LRFNFVVAAHLGSALHSSVFARLASGAFYETIVQTIYNYLKRLDSGFRRNDEKPHFPTFYESIEFNLLDISLRKFVLTLGT
jgi:hypothetical protein